MQIMRILRIGSRLEEVNIVTKLGKHTLGSLFHKVAVLKKKFSE